jgi:hypothetical protein
VKENEMGRGCSRNGGEEELMYVVSGKFGRKETITMAMT